ncbi:ABC transporter substrate-binding protein [Xinfangfangia pollutisoli]|uniref:ABC transporter substrate-binding protein n=1 Tax=Xinfangfangia pollutisoli TaxID=2865960 RepID=UPI001CD4CCB5|nr:ABC transporter substrate-binding protein [Xinfangfangia pollutisoli]
MASAWRETGARVGLAALALLAFSGTQSPARAEQGVVIARDMDLNSLDPARAFCDTCQIYLSAVYARLVDLDGDGRTIVPMLAESWQSDPAQTEFTFHLRKDAVFSDGSPVQAKDVVWSLSRLQHITAGAGYLLAGIETIEAVDDQTVAIRLKDPNSELLGLLSAPYAGILNSDLVAEHGGLADETADTADTAEAWLMENSAGAGPFVLSSYLPGESLRLTRNETYWGDKPQIEGATLLQMKESASQLQLVQSGGADIAMQVDALTASQISGDAVSVSFMPSQALVYLALSPGAKGNEVPLNAKVREGISHALDYDALIDLTVEGKGRRLASPVPLDFPGGSGLEPPAYDPALARKLLDEGGAPAEFTLHAAFPNVRQYGVDFTVMMQKVQMDLGAVGIKLDLEPLEFPIWRERANGEGIPLTAVFFVPDFYGSSQYFNYFGMFDGTTWYKRAGGASDPSLTDSAGPEILKQALGTSGAESEAAFAQLSALMAQDRIILPIVAPDTILVTTPALKGARISACCNLVLKDLHWEK